MPGGELSLAGADIILNPSASHFAFGKQRVRERFVLEGSRAFGVSYVYANLLGNEAGRVIYDGETMIASGGRMLAVGPRFSFADCQLTTAVIDVESPEVLACTARSGTIPLRVSSNAQDRITAGVLACIPVVVVTPIAMRVGERLSVRVFQYVVLAVLGSAAIRLLWSGFG